MFVLAAFLAGVAGRLYGVLTRELYPEVMCWTQCAEVLIMVVLGRSDRGITPCIPSRRNRKQLYPHDPALYRQRHPIENLFAKLKDWRRIATRYDRCADIFMGAVTFAAIIIFWLRK